MDGSTHQLQVTLLLEQMDSLPRVDTGVQQNRGKEERKGIEEVGSTQIHNVYTRNEP